MPNSERTLRRLRRLGIIVAVLGLFTVASAVYFQIRQDRTDACVEKKIDAVNESFSARSDAGRQDRASSRRESQARNIESQAIRRVLLALGRALEGDPIDPAEVAVLKDRLAAYDITAEEVRAELVAVRAERRETRADRRDTPVPDFPAGSCEEAVQQ